MLIIGDYRAACVVVLKTVDAVRSVDELYYDTLLRSAALQQRNSPCFCTDPYAALDWR